MLHEAHPGRRSAQGPGQHHHAPQDAAGGHRADCVIVERSAGVWDVLTVGDDRPADHRATRSDAVAVARRRIRAAGAGTLTVRDVHGSIVQTDHVTVLAQGRGHD